MTTFTERVYELVKTVPRGRVTTYKDVAWALDSNAYRAVGQAMRRNPFAPVVPCHRVVASDGSLGGFGGETQGVPLAQKERLLLHEGVVVENGFIKDFEKKRYRF